MTIRIPPLVVAGLLALGAADVWLVTVALEDIAPSDRVTTAPAEWTPKFSTSTDGILKPVPVDGYTETLAHPVFFKTREPFVPPPPVVPRPVVIPPPVFVDPGLVLGGVMILPNVRKAYLVSKADQRGTWVSQGEAITGWKVQSVDRTSIKLQQQDRIIELQLYTQPH
jgi:hypothetical protein